MQSKKRYTLSASKLAFAYFEGLIQKGSALYSAGDTVDSGRCLAILNRFRSYESGTKWGRFHCKSALSPSSTLRIYALAVDAEEEQAKELNRYFHDSSISWQQKRAHFERKGVLFVNHEDVLLYALTGEYLWIAIEIESGKERIAGVCDSIEELFLDSQGDNFMWTFPEIYQEEGGFFHRYMSVFSSVYQDMTDEIANMEQYLDLDTTPITALKEIAGWLGFAAQGDFLGENMLRSLVKEIYTLNRMKGTKAVIQKLIQVVLGQDAVIVERNKLEGHLFDDTRDTCQRLYGTSMQDVTILLKMPGDEQLQSQLLYLLNQFKPIRSRIKLVFCPSGCSLDEYCFLDYNAALCAKGEGSVDEGARMNGTVTLK